MIINDEDNDAAGDNFLITDYIDILFSNLNKDDPNKFSLVEKPEEIPSLQENSYAAQEKLS